jgi:long-chain acyl-CoA synthetase
MSLLPPITSSVRKRGAEPWLISYDPFGQRSEWSYVQCHETALRLAGWLTRHGIGPGDRIAVLSRNRPEVYLAYLAAWLIGAVACPINVEERTERKRFIVDHGRCVAVLFETEFSDQVDDLAAAVPALRQRLALDELLTVVAGEPPLEPQEQPPDAGAFLVYTSGTTGDPKGVMLSHDNLRVNALATAAWHRFGPGDTIMTVLPIHHVNGAVVTGLMSFLSGGRNVLLRSFSPSTFWQRCSAEGVVAASMVPTLLEYLLAANEDIAGYDLGSLRYLLCGAGPLLVDTVLRFEDRFGVAVCHGFGMSETTAYNTQFPMDMPTAHRRGWYSRHGYPSAGCALSCNEVTVLDPDGSEVARLERGEIAIRGPTVMTGYLDDSAASASAFTADWFRSGDQGFFDVDARGRHHLFITGRIKELIVRGGVNLSPLEIDEVLNAAPGVAFALAIPFAHRFMGEEVAAYVVPQPTSHPSEQEILRYAAARLPFALRPKVVVFGTEVPYTATGKPQRLGLAETLSATLAAYREVQFREA